MRSASKKCLPRRALNMTWSPDTYQGGMIFRTQRVGAFFYVAPEKWKVAAAVMKENGFRPALP